MAGSVNVAEMNRNGMLQDSVTRHPESCLLNEQQILGFSDVAESVMEAKRVDYVVLEASLQKKFVASFFETKLPLGRIRTAKYADVYQ